MKYVRRETVRDLDRQAIEDYKIPSVILMENAGAGATRIILDRISQGTIAILCGKGNNGGDGFVIARHLHNHGISVEVFFFGKIEDVSPSSDPGINLNILRKMGFEPTIIQSIDDFQTHKPRIQASHAIIDALFGTGLQGGLREPIASIIQEIASWKKRVFAIDIPSGLDANTGEVINEVLPAELTTTFALAKKGFILGRGPEVSGEIFVIDISIPREVLENVEE